MKKTLLNKQPILILILLYSAFVLIRFLLAILTSAYPMINIDEFLYYGMARSIAEGKGLMFRGQPADYSYIVYSLFLTPIYLLGIKGPLLYRLLQLWNIMAVTLSVFPLFYLAKSLTKDTHKSIIAVFISMLLPDFMIGQLMMCENLIIPLFYMVLCVFYNYFNEEKFKQIVLSGIIGGFLFSIKPGAVIPVIVFSIIILIKGLFYRNMKTICHAIICFATTVFISALFFGIVYLLGSNPSVLSIYSTQVADFSHMDVFFRFTGVYLLYFMLAGGVGFFVIICNNVKGFTSGQKNTFLILILSLLVLIIGVSWSVNRYEYNANTAHLRYIGMYLPVFYLFALIPTPYDSEKIYKTRQWIPIVVFSLLSLLLLTIGIYSGVTPGTVFVLNMTFAILIPLFNSQVSSLVVTVFILVIFIIFTFLFAILKKKELLLRIISAVFIVILLSNSIAAYNCCFQATQFDFARQAEGVREYLSDDDKELYLYSNERMSTYYGAFDVYSQHDISYASFIDLFNHLYKEHGIYKPFIPVGQRGNHATIYTPDTDTIVMDVSVYAFLKPSENTKHYSVDTNGLHIIKILDKAKPWLDYAAAVTKNGVLSNGDNGVLLLFSENYQHSPIRVLMRIKSDVDMEMIFRSEVETKPIQLMAGTHEYIIEFNQISDSYNFISKGGDIRFYKFLVETNNSDRF